MMGRLYLIRNCLILPVLALLILAGRHSFLYPDTVISGAEHTAKRSVRVVLDDNYPPYIFRDAQGVVKGILADRWKLWEKKTGITVNMTATNWGDAQKIMLSGGSDVIDTIFYSEKRAKMYDFSEPYARIDVPLYYSRDLSGIGGPEDLAGFVVGVKSGDNVIDILQAAGVSNLQLFDNYESIIKAAAGGKIRIFSVDKPPAIFFMVRYNCLDSFRESRILYSGRFHRAVIKGNNELLSIVESGFKMISGHEYDEIDRKWLGTPLLTGEALNRVAVSAFALLLLALVLAAWVWTLRRNVARRTAELLKANKDYQALNIRLEQIVQEKIGEIRKKDQFLVEQARYAAMGEMLAIISHQWRQPLSSVALVVQNLLMNYDHGKLTRELLVSKIASAMEMIDHMSRTIDDFRNFFKTDKEKKIFYIGLQVDKVLDMMRPGLEDQHIALDIDMGADAMVLGYANEYGQALMNLLANARDALRESGVAEPVIRIRHNTVNGFSDLSVADNGSGISPEIREKLFEPYFTTKSKGTGIGLFISRRIIEENMGGRLTVVDTTVGAEFHIILKTAEDSTVKVL